MPDFLHTTKNQLPLQIIPFPPERGFKIKWDEDFPETLKMELISFTGELILSKDFIGKKAREITLTLEGLPKGIYILCLKDNNKPVYYHRLKKG